MDNNEQTLDQGSGEIRPELDVFAPEYDFVFAPPKPKYWLHILLFVLTFLMSTIVGARMQFQFDHREILFIGDEHYLSLQWIFEDLSRLKMGLPFSCSLLGILFAHEMGHYLVCLYYGVYATLPFFIPVPTPAGTFGAFIQIRSPFKSRRELFDIAIGGPIAGFVVAVPVAAWGLAHSLALDHETVEIWKELHLNTPLSFEIVFRFLQWMQWAPKDSVNAHFLYYHPVAIAAWIGMLATMLNLLPGGQLDGGHIIQALTQRWHRAITWTVIVVMFVLCWDLWMGWLIWAIFLYVTRRHPDVPQDVPLGAFRWVLAVFALGLLVITFMPVPVFAEGNTLHDLAELLWTLIKAVFDWLIHFLRR